jgi:peptidoglycan-binding protein ArfA
MSVKRLALPWLIALVAIPLLIAAIGYGALDRPKSAAQSSGASSKATSTASGPPKLSLAAFSMARNGNSLTLSGDFPDASARAALLNALNGSLPPGVNIIDQIRINPDVDALDFAKAKPIFQDSALITDFTLTVNADTITLAGTAASANQKSSIDNDAKHTWSNLNIVDNIGVSGAASPSPPASAALCSDLQTTINAASDGQIAFDKNVFNLPPADDRVLTQVAAKFTACPTAHGAVNRYTDNSGNETLDIPLSKRRAQTVTDFLVAHGVTVDRLTITGLGAANPIATNDTAEARAENRRVEIVVS